MPIPKLTTSGILPPRDGAPNDHAASSPYSATSLELCQAFGGTPERRRLLRGLLDLRHLLHQLQVEKGYQWVAGTFVEDDRHQKKAPDHIQVVTFCHPSPRLDDVAYKDLADLVQSRKKVLQHFHVDHMPVLLSWPAELLVENTRHWLNLLSHQPKTNLWKGFLKIQLATVSEDLAARQHLQSQDAK